MKKLIKISLVFTLALIGFISVPKMSAATNYSDWELNADGYYYLKDSAWPSGASTTSGASVKLIEADDTIYYKNASGNWVSVPDTYQYIQSYGTSDYKQVYIGHYGVNNNNYELLQYKESTGTYQQFFAINNQPGVRNKVQLRFKKVIVNFDVTFNTNGGTAIAKTKVAEGSKLSQPTTPTKSGSVFEGWYTDSALTTRYNFNADVTSSLTLYAKWNLMNIKVNFYDGNSLSSSQNGDYGTAITLPTLTKTGFTFLGWEQKRQNGTSLGQIFSPFTLRDDTYYTLSDSNRITLSFYAIWSEDPKPIVRHDVTFNYNNGSTASVFSIESGNYIQKPTNPAKDGSVFEGWYSDAALTTAFNFNTPITANTTIYAKYTVMKITVKFYDGAAELTAHAKTQDYGTTITLPILEKEGHTFTGWEWKRANNTSLGAVSSPFTLRDDTYYASTDVNRTSLRLYATWQAIPAVTSFNVTFNVNDVTNTIAIAENTKVSKPLDPVLEGKVFVGWYANAAKTQEFNFNQNITQATTIYAKFENVEIKVSFFDKDNKIINAETKTGAFGTEITLPSISVEGFTFLGWEWRRVDGTVLGIVSSPFTLREDQYYAVGNINRTDLKLYAMFTAIPVEDEIVQITLVFNNGVDNTVFGVKKGEKIQTLVSPGINPLIQNAEFKGWYLDQQFKTKFNQTTDALNEDTTLYALWSQKNTDPTNPDKPVIPPIVDDEGKIAIEYLIGIGVIVIIGALGVYYFIKKSKK